MTTGDREFNRHATAAYRCFAVLAIAYIVSQFFRVSNAVIAPELMSTLALSPESMGAITGIFFLSFGIMQIPTGILLDRFGPRFTLSGLLVIAVGGSALFSASSSADGLLASRALIGIGCAAGLMGSMVAIARWFPPERFAAMSSWLFAIGGVGTLLATTPLAALSESIGWRGSFWWMTATTALMAILVFAVVRDYPPGQRPDPKSRDRGEIASGLGEVLRNRDLWHVSAIQFVNYGSLLAISGLWGGPYLNDVHGLGGVARGNVLLAMNVATICGVLAFSVIERWVGSRKRTVAAGAVASTVILLALAAKPDLPLELGVAALIGFGLVNTYVMLLHAHARAVLPDRIVGRGLTLENLAVFIGIAVLQWVSGLIVGAFSSGDGPAPAAAFQAVFAFLAAATLIALLAYLPIRDVNTRPGADNPP